MVVITALQHSVKYILGSIRPSATNNTDLAGFYSDINVISSAPSDEWVAKHLCTISSGGGFVPESTSHESGWSVWYKCDVCGVTYSASNFNDGDTAGARNVASQQAQQSLLNSGHIVGYLCPNSYSH